MREKDEQAIRASAEETRLWRDLYEREKARAVAAEALLKQSDISGDLWMIRCEAAEAARVKLTEALSAARGAIQRNRDAEARTNEHLHGRKVVTPERVSYSDGALAAFDVALEVFPANAAIASANAEPPK